MYTDFFKGSCNSLSCLLSCSWGNAIANSYCTEVNGLPWWNPFVDDHVVEHEAGLNNPVAFLRREFMKVPCLKRKKQWWVLNWSTAFYTLKNITMKVNNSAINLLVFEKIKFRLFEQQSKSMVLFFFKLDISFKCFTSILNENPHTLYFLY